MQTHSGVGGLVVIMHVRRAVVVAVVGGALWGGFAPQVHAAPADMGPGQSRQPGKVVFWDDDDQTTEFVPAEVRSGVTAVAAAAGGFRSSPAAVALRRGKVIAWHFSPVPVPKEARSGVTAIAGGFSTLMAVKAGQVIIWDAESGRVVPVPAEARSGVSAIAGGEEHYLALKGGAVIAWGSNAHGQTDVPEEAQSGVTAIAAGQYYSLALKAGEVIAWGDNSEGQISVPPEAQSGVTAIAAGNSHALALKAGRVIAWGWNFNGQTSVPASVRSGVTSIAAGYNQSIALKAGRVIGWGWAYKKPRMSQGDAISSARTIHYPRHESVVTVPAEALSGVTAIAAASNLALAIKGR